MTRYSSSTSTGIATSNADGSPFSIQHRQTKHPSYVTYRIHRTHLAFFQAPTTLPRSPSLYSPPPPSSLPTCENAVFVVHVYRRQAFPPRRRGEEGGRMTPPTYHRTQKSGGSLSPKTSKKKKVRQAGRTEGRREGHFKIVHWISRQAPLYHTYGMMPIQNLTFEISPLGKCGHLVCVGNVFTTLSYYTCVFGNVFGVVLYTSMQLTPVTSAV